MTWNPLWPTPSEVRRVLLDTEVYYKPRLEAVPWQVTEDHMSQLTTDPSWLLWVMNPRLDHVIPPSRINPQHWVNMCLVPIHAPCKMAIRALGPAFLQRVRCGEVVQSHRPRYISGDVKMVEVERLY